MIYVVLYEKDGEDIDGMTLLSSKKRLSAGTIESRVKHLDDKFAGIHNFVKCETDQAFKEADAKYSDLGYYVSDALVTMVNSQSDICKVELAPRKAAVTEE